MVSQADRKIRLKIIRGNLPRVTHDDILKSDQSFAGDPLNSIDWVVAGRRGSYASLAKLLSDDLKAAGYVLVQRDGEFVIELDLSADQPALPDTPPPAA